MDTFKILTLAFVGCMVICFIANFIVTGKTGKPMKWGTRLLHIFGILAALANAVRITQLYEGNKWTMLFADAVVVICLIISLVRAEKGKNPEVGDEEDAEE